LVRGWSGVRRHKHPPAYARKVLLNGTVRSCAGRTSRPATAWSPARRQPGTSPASAATTWCCDRCCTPRPVHGGASATPDLTRGSWWARKVSNLRPLPCERKPSPGAAAGPERLPRSTGGLRYPQRTTEDRCCPVDHAPWRAPGDPPSCWAPAGPPGASPGPPTAVPRGGPDQTPGLNPTSPSNGVETRPPLCA